MRKAVILVLLLFIVIVSGVFTVDERENAVLIDYSKQHIVYLPGIHFALPLINQINYVFINERSSFFEVPQLLNTKDLNKVKLSVLINWHVIDPIIYLNIIKKYGSNEFNKELTKELSLKIESFAMEYTLAHLNQIEKINEFPVKLSSLGIIVDSLLIENLSLLPQTSLVTESKSLSENKQKVIEAAYYKAQGIKTATQIEEAQLYNQIKNKNPKFYEYFRKIDIYKTSAKSKNEVPPLKQLYN